MVFAQRLRVRATWSAVGTGSDYLVSLFLAFALGRHFGPVVYGLLPLALSIIELPRTVCSVALGTSLVRHVARLAPEDDVGLARATRAGAVLMLGTGLVLALATALFSSHLARAFGRADLAPLLDVGALVVAGGSALWFIQASLQGRGGIAQMAQSQILSSVVRLVVTMILVWVLGAGVSGAMFGVALGYVAAAAVYAGPAMHRIRILQVPRGRGTYRRLVGYSVPLMASWVAFFFAGRVDLIILGAFSRDSAAVGYLAIAASVALAPYILVSAVSTALSPTVTRSWTLQDTERLDDIFTRAHRGVALVYVPLSCGMVILVKPLITILLPTFGPSGILAQVLCAGMAVRAVGALCSGGMLTPSGFAKDVAWLAAATAAANVLLDVALIPVLGALGSAIGTTVVFGVNGVVAFILVHRRMKLEPKWVAIYRTPVVASAAASVIVLLVLLARPVRGLADLAEMAALGTVCYAVALYAADANVRRRTKATLVPVAQRFGL